MLAVGFASIVHGGLEPRSNVMECGLERMYETTLVDTHMMEKAEPCDSSVDGPTCGSGPISFLDGMFPTNIVERQAYYFFQSSTDDRFKAEVLAKEARQTVLPGQTFEILSCTPGFASKPQMPSWVTVEGSAVCSPDGTEVEFQNQITRITFDTAVFVDFIEGYRLPAPFPVVIIGNDGPRGAQWDILVADDGIPVKFRKEPVRELVIAGPALRLKTLRVVYYPRPVVVDDVIWHLSLDPQFPTVDPSIRVAQYENLGFNFVMQVPTIAPMTSVRDMQRNGLRLRKDIMGPVWKVVPEVQMDSTNLAHVREMLLACISSNCQNYSSGLSPESVVSALAVLEENFRDPSWEDISNMSNFADYFGYMWKKLNASEWKLMLIRYRWNKFLTMRGVEPIVLSSPPVPPSVITAATTALVVIDSFAKISHSISHREDVLRSIGSVRVHHTVVGNDIHMRFFALVSGRQTNAVFTPTVTPDAFFAELFGIRNTRAEPPPEGTPAPPAQIPAYKALLKRLLQELRDMEDHEALAARERDKNPGKEIDKDDYDIYAWWRLDDDENDEEYNDKGSEDETRRSVKGRDAQAGRGVFDTLFSIESFIGVCAACVILIPLVIGV